MPAQSRLTPFSLSLVIASMALGAAACGTHQSVLPVAPAAIHVSSGSAIIEARRLTSSMGWALTDNGLNITSNAGQSWTNVTPRGLRGADIGTAFFLDPTYAWLVGAVSSGTNAAPSPMIFSSRDGGAHWSSRALAIVSSGLGIQAVYLTFIDPEHGWLVVDAGSHGGSSVANLYRTADGGATWTTGTAPQSATVIFTDQDNGVSSGGPAGHGLFSTHDGGRTWQPQRLPVPDSFRGAVPGRATFVNPTDAVLPADLFDANSLPAGIGIYVTRDRGQSWNLAAHRANPDARRRPSLGFSVIDLNSWFLALPTASAGSAGGSRLLVTRDRGSTWKDVRGVDTVTIDATSFATLADGWAVMAESICNGVHNCDQKNGLFRTTDGGLTWHQLPI